MALWGGEQDAAEEAVQMAEQGAHVHGSHGFVEALAPRQVAQQASQAEGRARPSELRRRDDDRERPMQQTGAEDQMAGSEENGRRRSPVCVITSNVHHVFVGAHPVPDL